MSSFLGTLLLLHHIKELETGKDRSILISETLHFFPSWNPGLRLISRIGALPSNKSTCISRQDDRGYPHQGILKSVFWFKNPLQVSVTNSYRTLEVTECHTVQMSLAPGTQWVPGNHRRYKKKPVSVYLSVRPGDHWGLIEFGWLLQ